MAGKHADHDDIPMAGVFHRVSMIAKNHMSDRLKTQKWFMELGFRPPTIAIIHSIGRMQPVSQKDVSNWIGMDPSDLVGAIDHLESEGYVVRKRDPQDRRRQLLSLTTKGSNLRKKLKEVGQAAIDETLEPLSSKERDVLKSLLVKLLDHHHQEKAQ